MSTIHTLVRRTHPLEELRAFEVGCQSRRGCHARQAQVALQRVRLEVHRHSLLTTNDGGRRKLIFGESRQAQCCCVHRHSKMAKSTGTRFSLQTMEDEDTETINEHNAIVSTGTRKWRSPPAPASHCKIWRKDKDNAIINKHNAIVSTRPRTWQSPPAPASHWKQWRTDKVNMRT